MEEDKRPPDVAEVDSITRSVSRIVLHCRSVEQGFLASVDEEALSGDVDALTEIADEVDPDASYRLPESAIRRQTTLRDQVDLAARVLDEDCSPEMPSGCARRSATESLRNEPYRDRERAAHDIGLSHL